MHFKHLLKTIHPLIVSSTLFSLTEHKYEGTIGRGIAVYQRAYSVRIIEECQ